MRSPLLIAGTLLLFFLPIPLVSQTPSVSDSLAAKADQLFTRWRGTANPGCAAAVDLNGGAVFRNAYGIANLETDTRNTPGTVFLAASIAKQFTAMSVMLLVEEGRLSLDDDIRKFLPEIPDYGNVITVRRLLTHTSGLRDYFEMLILARGRFEEDRITRADFLDIITRQKALNFVPGAEYLYSNTGFALLAMMVERISGQSFPDFTRTRLFEPLGMSHTRFLENYSTPVLGRASGYDPDGPRWRLRFANYDVYGSTNLFTTVDDLLLWTGNFSHPRVGTPAIIRQMTTRAVLSNGDSVDYGFGLGLWNDNGRQVVEHEGSDPGFRAYLGNYPAQDLSVAVLCNTRSADAVYLGHSLANLYIGESPASPVASPILPIIQGDTASQALRAGIYFQPEELEVVEMTWREGHLYTARRGGRRLNPVGRDSFQLDDLPVLHTFGRAPRSNLVVRSLLPGRHPTNYQWHAPAAQSRKSLAAYSGEFFSPELNSHYRVTAADSTIHLWTGTSEGLIAWPVFGDTFTSGQIVIQFTRLRGRVTGFRLSHPRARGMRFVRNPEAAD